MLNRRKFVATLTAALAFACVRPRPVAAAGRYIDIRMHSGYKHRAWLDGVEVSRDTVAAQEGAYGFVEVLLRNGQGRHYLDKERNQVARGHRYGQVRIECMYSPCRCPPCVGQT